MLVPGRIYANARMVAELRDDPALGQVANVTCLPSIVGYSLALPDIHWGYGFPIGGVAAVDADVGVSRRGASATTLTAVCAWRVRISISSRCSRESIASPMHSFNDNRPHYPYYAFPYTLFFTGMRPSEAVAARVGNLNLTARTLQVERSRHLGEEAAPKTQRARRAVRLTQSNAGVLEPLIELRAQPGDYLFKSVWGMPIDAANFLRPVP
jgi:hypothetical protein